MGDSKGSKNAPGHKSAPGGGTVKVPWPHPAPKPTPSDTPSTKK